MNEFYPLISVVIPVYNGSNYLKNAIDSAISQTYGNLEIIVVNDGSTDGGKTEAIALSYGNRIRYIAKENGGVSTALNRGIKEARGDYISWLSHDDEFLPDKIEKQVNFLKKSKNKYVFIFGNYEVVDEKSSVLYEINLDHNMLSRKPLYAVLRGCINGCTTLIPKKSFEETGYFDEKLPATQDYDLWFRMVQKISIASMDDIFIKSRVHQEQGSRNIKAALEANKLWAGFIDNTDIKEMKEYEGSKYLFILETLKFIKATLPSYTDVIEQFEQILKKEYIAGKERFNKAKDGISVSVILKVNEKNENYEKSLKSILEQTFPVGEVIVIGCEDKIPAKLDGKINHLIISENDIIKAANIAIERASGSHIAFLDSDSYWEKNKIEEQMIFMEVSGASLCHTTYKTTDPLSRQEITAPAKISGRVFPMIIEDCPIAYPTVIIKKEIVTNGIRFDVNTREGCEKCFWISAAQQYPVACLESPLTKTVPRGKSSKISEYSEIYNVIKFCYDNFECQGISSYTCKGLSELFADREYYKKNKDRLRHLLALAKQDRDFIFTFIDKFVENTAAYTAVVRRYEESMDAIKKSWSFRIGNTLVNALLFPIKLIKNNRGK